MHRRGARDDSDSDNGGAEHARKLHLKVPLGSVSLPRIKGRQSHQTSHNPRERSHKGLTSNNLLGGMRTLGHCGSRQSNRQRHAHYIRQRSQSSDVQTESETVAEDECAVNVPAKKPARICLETPPVAEVEDEEFISPLSDLPNNSPQNVLNRARSDCESDASFSPRTGRIAKSKRNNSHDGHVGYREEPIRDAGAPPGGLEQGILVSNGGEHRWHFTSLVSELKSLGRHRKAAQNEDAMECHTPDEEMPTTKEKTVLMPSGCDNGGGSSTRRKGRFSTVTQDKPHLTNLTGWLGKGNRLVRGGVQGDEALPTPVHSARGSEGHGSETHRGDGGAHSVFTSTSSHIRNLLNPHTMGNLFGGRFPRLQHDGDMDGIRPDAAQEHCAAQAVYPRRDSTGRLDAAEGRPPTSLRMHWGRKGDGKRGHGKLRRVSSWGSMEVHGGQSRFEVADDFENHAQMMEEVRSLRLLVDEYEEALEKLCQEQVQNRRVQRREMRRLAEQYSSLKDTQELRYSTTLDMLNENQKALGYIESSYDYVVSVLGSGRGKCPGMWGHVIGGLRHMGDNTMEFLFATVRLLSIIYVRFLRVKHWVSGVGEQ